MLSAAATFRPNRALPELVVIASIEVRGIYRIPGYQSIFNANWITRPLAALVMWPNVPLLTVWLGLAKFTWFSELKNSARNCGFHHSRSANSFSAERSVLDDPGPLINPRPELP